MARLSVHEDYDLTAKEPIYGDLLWISATPSVPYRTHGFRIRMPYLIDMPYPHFLFFDFSHETTSVAVVSTILLGFRGVAGVMVL